MAKQKPSPKKKKAESAPAESSWRAITQNGQLRSTSSAARERRLSRVLRLGAIGLAVLLLGGGLGYALYFSGSHLEVFSPMGDPVPLSEVDFASDGVLDQRWFLDRFPLDGETSAMNFDVHALQQQLEGVGQVSEATVSIVLPEGIRVRVKERVPILRARVKTPDGVVRTVLVAADGAVYEGSGYPPETLRHLPGLTGVRFQWTPSGFRPIEAIRAVAPLLEQARTEFPDLYRTWQWVSLEDLHTDPTAPHALITVKSRDADRIVFAPRVFRRQLTKLNEVVSLAHEQRHRGFRKIDLSFSDQAIVQFRES